MLKSGKQWPIFVATAIMGVVGLSYWTIKETMKTDLSQSNIYMEKYQSVDENINEIIEANIAFDKKYTLELTKHELGKKDAYIEYTLHTKDGKPVNDAKMKLVLTRPISDAKDIVLRPTQIKNGTYSFENIHLPKRGRWNLLLRVNVGKNERYYNLKADTRTYKIAEI